MKEGKEDSNDCEPVDTGMLELRSRPCRDGLFALG